MGNSRQFDNMNIPVINNRLNKKGAAAVPPRTVTPHMNTPPVANPSVAERKENVTVEQESVIDDIDIVDDEILALIKEELEIKLKLRIEESVDALKHELFLSLEEELDSIFKS